MRPSIRQFGDHAVLMDWAVEINEATHRQVLSANRLILELLGEQLIETVISYHSLALYFKPQADVDEFMAQLGRMELEGDVVSEGRTIEVPVCYDPEFGPDLKQVATVNKLEIDEVIRLHSTPEYHVLFLGFLPGFPYLSGLHARLVTPRRDSPRIRIEAGSVGIGGGQTGIYPMTSPGGWHIIGRSPLRLFSVENDPPALFNPGDRLKFKTIDKNEFEIIRQAISEGTYKIRTKTND